ncbi:MAG TPA: aldolase/citrate lyase family protein [Ramlibacter sp.]|uniref:HpcH/HpaI aldolase family protein n=1 Tax=Ramlibacter sp. TaxID=1917967 RepID=UPI002C05A1C1|nr:aldolase/citrate lyase family protein [Ramlibacter sp.]HVZ42870.1 aldolase/citrate lyase family protein [Ramlibacter sp.]
MADTKDASFVTQGRKLGILNFSGSSKLVEIAAHTGFDFIIIDTEHTTTSWATVDHMILAARANGLPVLVRVGKPDELEILRALDAGADGVVISHVTTADVARAAVAAAYYPPRGIRGMCPAIRPVRYGELPWHEHAQASNKRVVVICLIEDVEGLNNVEAISAVEGIDVIWCGSGDLSSSLGIHHSGLEHPRMREAMTRIRDACTARGITFMATAGSRPTPEYVRELWEFGAPIVSLAPDLMLVRNAFADTLKRLRGAQ